MIPLRIESFDGTVLAFEARPGRGRDALCLVHATGFCKETWQPVIEELDEDGAAPLVLIDQRAHGDSAVPEPPYDWWDLGRDVIAVLSAVPERVGAGAGHSSGATALAMAELLAPGSFEALVLIEPIILPPPFRRLEDNRLSAASLRRRRSFPSAQEALENFLGKEAFAGWDRRALEAYVQGGFELADGAWTLKCPPQAEAEFYRGATAHGAWDRIGEIRCPVVVVAGEQSESHVLPFVERQVRRFPQAELVIVPGATHFVPMEQPAAVAAVIAGAMGWQ
ncbi:MAG: alpha/beta fold hydrolase [Acidimicrobiia bacterium]